MDTSQRAEPRVITSLSMWACQPCTDPQSPTPSKAVRRSGNEIAPDPEVVAAMAALAPWWRQGA